VKLGQPWIRQVVPGVSRVGTTYVGCYAVEDAVACTFIDAGPPGYWEQMTGFFASRGAASSAVIAVVLTHHPTPITWVMPNGSGPRRVFVHHDDLAAAMRKAGKPRGFPAWKPPVFRLALHFLRNGAAQTVPVAEASSFADREVLDVAGRSVDPAQG